MFLERFVEEQRNSSPLKIQWMHKSDKTLVLFSAYKYSLVKNWFLRFFAIVFENSGYDFYFDTLVRS